MVTTSRFISIAILAIILNCLLIGTVFAGFFSSDDNGKSGLDFSSGYDVNTVRTISGRTVSLPHPGENNNIIFEIKNGSETLHICVGPEAYWGKKGIAISLNDEITAKGSKAQGQDGKTYILAQNLVNRTTSAKVELRSEKGEPAWSGRNMDSPRSERSAGGMGNRGSGMMRGGGGMMRR